MRSIQIKNSYNIWKPLTQRIMLSIAIDDWNPDKYLNRSWRSIHIEWWLHNIGYYITLPFIRYEKLKEINLRCKDVDLEEWK